MLVFFFHALTPFQNLLLFFTREKFGTGQICFLGGSNGKESACNAGNLGSILGSGNFPGEGNVNPLQYSSLENSMDIATWWTIAHGASPKESGMTERLTLSISNVKIQSLT